MRPPRPPPMGGSDRLVHWGYRGMPAPSKNSLLGLWGAFKSLAFRPPLWRHTATSSRRFYDGIIPSRRFDICRRTSYYKRPYGSRGRARRALTKRVFFKKQKHVLLRPKFGGNTMFLRWAWPMLSFDSKVVGLESVPDKMGTGFKGFLI